MKKILSFILVLTMAFGLFACSTNTISNIEEKVEENVSNESTELETKEETTSSEKFIVATNAEFPPYEFKEGQKFMGIDMEIAEEIAKSLGKELEVMDINFDSILPAVVNGKADMAAAGITVTEDRKQNVDFSDTYTKAVQKVIILDSNSDINSVEDLKEKQIGVQQGTTGDIYCSGDFGEDNVVRFTKIADGIQPLKNGQVDCLVVDDQVALNLVDNNTNLKVLDTAYAEEEYAFAVQKGNEELLSKVNEVISELKSSGKLEGIISKYIK